MKIKDFKVGDRVVMRDYHGRTSEENATMREMVVVKVGTKRITVQYPDGYGYTEVFCNGDGGNYSEFCLVEATVNGFRGDNKLFRSEEDFKLWQESKELDNELRNIFSGYRIKDLTFDQKKRIKAIIDETCGAL